MTRAWWVAPAFALACAGGPSEPAAGPVRDERSPNREARATGPLGDAATPAQVCRAGCAKIEQCADELVAGEMATVERCRRDCARLDQSRRAGMAQLNACLGETECGSFAECVRAPAEAAPRVAVALAEPGAQMTDCEAVCGGYADCSSATERASASVAARLEMQCLGRCLAARGSAEQPNPVLACRDREFCGDLIECIQAAGPTHPEKGREPRPTGRRPCEAICDSMMACQGIVGDSNAAGVDEFRAQCQEYLCASEDAGGERRLAACLSVTDCDELLKCLTQP